MSRATCRSKKTLMVVGYLATFKFKHLLSSLTLTTGVRRCTFSFSVVRVLVELGLLEGVADP